MWIQPNIDRLKRLNLDELTIGDSIIFCPKCTFQAVNVGMKPICPNCSEGLHITRVDKELMKVKL